MKEMKYLEATEFDNIKEIIYNSAEKYKNNTAFILKTKEGKKTEYTNISYKKLLEDIKIGILHYRQLIFIKWVI